MSTTRFTFPIFLLVLCLLAACAKQQSTSTTPPAPTIGAEHTIQTIVTGIDQFDEGRVWGLNTGHGTFVVGPEVYSAVKDTIYEHIMETHNQVVIIRYADVPASGEIIAHKRVTAITIQGTEYDFLH